MSEIADHPGSLLFRHWSLSRSMAWYGLIAVGVGVALVIVSFVFFSSCSGQELIGIGAGILVIGVGMALLGGLPAIYLMGPLGVIVLIAGVVLRTLGYC